PLATRTPGAAGARRSPRRLISPVLKTFLDDPPEDAVWEFEHRSAAHVQCELFQFGEARSGELVCEGSGGESEVAAQARGQAFQEAGGLCAAGRFEFSADLEASPCCPVEKFAVVGRSYQ